LSQICRLIAERCPHCRSQLVHALEAGKMDRIICPICLASGESEQVMADLTMLKRGTPIDGRLRFLVDKARFPRAQAATSPVRDGAPTPVAARGAPPESEGGPAPLRNGDDPGQS
jgi:hypothetical protein